MHMFCVSGIHLCYEQAMFSCTAAAAAPYLHITPDIAAAGTTSWATFSVSC